MRPVCAWRELPRYTLPGAALMGWAVAACRCATVYVRIEQERVHIVAATLYWLTLRRQRRRDARPAPQA